MQRSITPLFPCQREAAGQGETPIQQQGALDIDKLCLLDADTAFCVCRHRWTNERLDLPHEECVERARRHDPAGQDWLAAASKSLSSPLSTSPYSTAKVAMSSS